MPRRQVAGADRAWRGRDRRRRARRDPLGGDDLLRHLGAHLPRPVIVTLTPPPPPRLRISRPHLVLVLFPEPPENPTSGPSRWTLVLFRSESSRLSGLLRADNQRNSCTRHWRLSRSTENRVPILVNLSNWILAARSLRRGVVSRLASAIFAQIFISK